MNIQAEEIEDILDDSTFFVCFSFFKTSSEDVIDEVDGDPWWIIYTENYYNYSVYHRETDNTFFVILTLSTVETDDRCQCVKEEYFYYDYYCINNIKSILSHHKDDVLKKIKEYKKDKEDIKTYFNNNVYYELMEKTLHPDRVKWFI